MSYCLVDGQISLCSGGTCTEAEPAPPTCLLVPAAAAGLGQRHLLTPFYKGQMSGDNEGFVPSCTIWEGRCRVMEKLEVR